MPFLRTRGTVEWGLGFVTEHEKGKVALARTKVAHKSDDVLLMTDQLNLVTYPLPLACGTARCYVHAQLCVHGISIIVCEDTGPRGRRGSGCSRN